MQQYAYQATEVKVTDERYLKYQGGYAPLPRRGELLDPETISKSAMKSECPPTLYRLSSDQKNRVLSREGVLEGGRVDKECYIPKVPELGTP